MRAHHHHSQAQPEAPSPPNAEQLAGARTFAEFYPLYLAEHRQPLTRRLHFIGSTLALICLFFLIFTANPWWLPAAVICGYAFAWAAHFFVEHNRPATFKCPLFSLMGDWVMWWQMLTTIK